MNEFFILLQSTKNVESTLALHHGWTPESQNSFRPLKASQVPPIWAVVDEAQLEHLGEGVEVADKVMGGDVEVVVEVGHCAVSHVPRHQDHLWREHHGWRKNVKPCKWWEDEEGGREVEDVSWWDVVFRSSCAYIGLDRPWRRREADQPITRYNIFQVVSNITSTSEILYCLHLMRNRIPANSTWQDLRLFVVAWWKDAAKLKKRRP